MDGSKRSLENSTLIAMYNLPDENLPAFTATYKKKEMWRQRYGYIDECCW